MPKVESGDIVFQTSKTEQSQALKLLTGSPFTHCGIFFRRPNGEEIVVDGDGRGEPRTWKTWKAAGVDGKASVYRWKGGLDAEQKARLFQAASRLDGRPYDPKFAWGEDEIYCSEQTWLAYKAIGLKLCALETIGEFDLEHPTALTLIERPGSWGSLAAVPRDMKAISPVEISRSDRLVVVRKP